MLAKILFFFVIGCFIISCANEGGETTTPDNKRSLDPIKIEVQSIFDQSQLNSKVLDACTQFKAMEGADRLQVFELFEKILPSCPMKLLNNNTSELDKEDAVQVMSINDLKEILGAPTEIREDGHMVYELLGDGSYRVVFIPEVNGSVACRVYEGDS